jgi:hypothetical protein
VSFLDTLRERVAGHSVNLQAALGELAHTEGNFMRGWSAAFFLYTTGALSRREWETFQRERTGLASVQREIYVYLREVLTTVGQQDRIPAPPELPTIPPYESMPRFGAAAQATSETAPATTSNGATAAQSASEMVGGVRAAGLGVAPLVIWAAAVAIVIIALAEIYMIIRVVQLAYDTILRIYTHRENTRRFELTVTSQERRFQSCLRSGGTVESCGRLFPTPEPQYEEEPPAPADPLVWGIGIAAGVLSLGAVGYLFYEFASPGKLGAWKSSGYSSTPTKVKQLKGAAVSRALRGGR